MRVIKTIPHPDFLITLFSWNNRFIIKLEMGWMEQTFKVDAFSVSEADVPKLLTSEFLEAALFRFREMDNSLKKALEPFR